MKKMYEFFELPYYQHNWDNIEQITHENDAVHGIFGDHKIRNKLEAQKEDFYEILGNYTCDRIKNEYKFSENPSWDLIKIGMKTNANLFNISIKITIPYRSVFFKFSSKESQL